MNLLVTIIGFFAVTSSLLAHVALWQRKEYRFDRLQALARDLDRERPALAAYALGLVAALLTWSGRAPHLLATGGLGILVAFMTLRIARRGVVRPKPTTRALSVLGTSALLVVAVWWSISNLQPLALLWLLLTLLTPLLVALAVILVALPATLRKRQLIKQAMAKRKALSHLTVVGITGSYGKTSTKEFLGHILTAVGKPHLLSDARRNAPYPLAQDMMARLTEDTSLYIAEMGAYRRGEIADLGKLVQPTVAAITAIGNQHLELFGSRENLAAAKWELAEALPASGMLVINGDDEELQRKASSLDGTVTRFTLSGNSAADLSYKITRVEAQALTVEITEGSHTVSARVPLAGEHQLLAVASSASLARVLDLSLEDVVQALESLTSVERTMELAAGFQGSTVIDDSYSANEQGVIAAVQHLAHFAGDKLIVLTPLIELGSESDRAHEYIGHELAKAEADVLVTGTAHRAALKRGWNTESSQHSLTFEADPAKTIELLRKKITGDMTVLLEGRIPDAIRTFLIK